MVSIGAVVAQLVTVDSKLAAAVVTASRAQADADQAFARYEEAAQGSDHPEIRQAIADIRTASEKAAKVARLLNKTRKHVTNYINAIAPGAAPAEPLLPGSMPEGQRLVSETERRGRKGEAFLRQEVKKAADHEDGLKQGEQIVTAGSKGLLKMIKDERGPTQTTTVTPKSPSQPAERPQVDHPITAILMSIGAGIVGVKGTLNMIRNRRKRKLDGNQASHG
ncbi:hypothetical protein ACFP2T_03610 [Plantactinospora solaniradicis]|uniref:DUF3618 domain-containing protein n=1 Tax=Plantactinospora solaniradicis TaxID=1723736 RepID=A0ABW1K1U4_9ACTN